MATYTAYKGARAPAGRDPMYVDRLIGSAGGEHICLAVRPHWFRFARQGAGSLLLVLNGVALVLFQDQLGRLLEGLTPFLQFLPVRPDPSGTHAGAFASSSGSHETLGMALSWGGGAMIVLGALVLGWVMLSRHFTEYAITASGGYDGYGDGGRIIKVQGVLSRQTVAVPLSMVNDLVLYEPLLGRLLGWGHIDIATGNDFEGDRLEHIPNPRAFYQVWQALLNSWTTVTGVTGEPPM